MSEALGHLRSSGALLGKTLADRPWSIEFAESASLTTIAVLRGTAWVVMSGEQQFLEEGDVAVVVGANLFAVTSDPQQNPDPLYVQSEGGVCLDADGQIADDIRLGTRTCGTRMEADDAVLTGSFGVRGRIAGRLIDTLPRMLAVPQASRHIPALALLETEVVRDEPGQQTVLDRLLDLVLVGVLRCWFARPEATVPGWYRAHADPVVGPALSALHESPELRWDIEQLAGVAGVSRATLARRFAQVVGEPPMSYLAGWRLCAAADMFEDSDATVDAVARAVGYSSAHALSAAFLREYGVRPGRYRKGQGVHPRRK